MVGLIVGCEVAFWVLLGLGLSARYLVGAPRLGAVLLACVPVIDVMLLVLSTADLYRGATPDLGHALAGVYLGVTVAFGPTMVRWADERVVRATRGRRAGAARAGEQDGRRREAVIVEEELEPSPRGSRAGRSHAARERVMWLRHLLAYAIAAATLGVFTLIVGDLDQTVVLWGPMLPWSVALGIDFLWSFSYTLAPRRAK
ncbi:hypothetical protein [Nonomuraea aurantiaca]|uniref:hypothetical protein n=1 Tax=Nonomuraea aurantiaca TaxID=2878562 RepID=UPI001CDA0D56|nr:hypothetical protein [Nonomuraea aurantiaca]MCA2230261.1 hypothetical protein [Nonomuraea aurantiaca]